MSANDRQVGGTHYKSDYQHWTWVKDCDIGYLDGAASRYVVRWKKKNGVQDLEKSLHYVDKMIEDYAPRSALTPGKESHFLSCCSKLANANGLSTLEADICKDFATWCSLSDLNRIRENIQLLIETAKAVPVEDSNRHAERT